MTRKRYVASTSLFILVFLGIWTLLGLLLKMNPRGFMPMSELLGLLLKMNNQRLLFIPISFLMFVLLLVAFLSGLRFGKKAIIVATILPIAPVTMLIVALGVAVYRNGPSETAGFAVFALILTGWQCVGFLGAMANLAFTGSLINSRGLTVLSVSAVCAFAAVDAFLLSPVFQIPDTNNLFTNPVVLRGLATFPVILMLPVLLMYGRAKAENAARSNLQA